MNKTEETGYDVKSIDIKELIEIFKLLDDADRKTTEQARQDVQKRFDERIKKVLDMWEKENEQKN